MEKLLLLINIVCHLINVTSGTLMKSSNTNRSTITAPNAGVVLLYKGQYIPSDQVIHNTASFPMTTTTCYLLPAEAARKIPACGDYNIHIRNKRLLTDVISIATSTIALTAAVAATGMATTSLVLTKNLEKRVNQFETSLHTMSDRITTGEARMLQFETNQIKLGITLQNSNRLLNATIDLVNQHSTALDTHEKRLDSHQQAILSLQQQFKESELVLSNRFLHLAIHDIINNKATLSFLHPSDIHLVVTKILQEANITIGNSAAQLPLVEIITKLIIRQQIDFIPAERYSNASDTEIGKLMFTNFYAIPSEQKSSYDIYNIITGPFMHHNKSVRLAQMPTYIGINEKRNLTISWSNNDLSPCIFDIMTTCRETPAEQTFGQGNICLEQILSGEPLLNCRTESAKVNLPHIQQLENGRWLISTNNTSLHCIRTTTQLEPSGRAAVWSENTEMIIPPVALISVMNGTTIHCPGFNLPGPLTPNTKSVINIIKNLSTAESTNEIIDMHKDLASNETWQKLPYINGEMDVLMQEMLLQTTYPTNYEVKLPWHTQHSGKLLIIVFVSFIMLTITIILLVWRSKQTQSGGITIALPQITI
uniref:Envelope fusion glycoprotein n=1 Tax=Adineta vaga TaxID=104782 RepID=A0A1W6BQY9_ADIVA|nr:envelope fusion glycoprotein [Adineta vaga]